MIEPVKLFVGSFKMKPEIGMPMTDFEAMRWSLAQAWRGAGQVSPNPMVGCVILSQEGKLLGYGHHPFHGGPHAEIVALAHMAQIRQFNKNEQGWDLSNIPRDRLKGSRWFVTLEPCAHEGMTPSCAKTLAQLPIKELVYGLIDPNPQVAGKGLAILENAGITVTRFSALSPEKTLQQELEEVIEHFRVNVLYERPFISLKIAASLDGMFCLQDGQSQWITGERSREMGHFFRGMHDSIMVGRGTIERDNPKLTIRYPEFKTMIKKVIVVDPHGTLFGKPELNVFQNHRPENLIWAVGHSVRAPFPKDINVIQVDSNSKGIDLIDLHRKLWDLKIRSVFIEGGGKTLSAHLKSGTGDRLCLFQAPTIIGSGNGRSWSEGFAINRLDEQPRLKGSRRMSLGKDSLITGRIYYPGMAEDSLA